ncbi:glycosyltransferase family 4 protein [Gracilinema caldarium]|uniref:Glycosyl transferase group 1 n=1 Tax=Gracilinema caldarium (strain ATCC 51460 / DSM 7334 / H1) TaxID=744872 RepID=F8F4E4_GRAC1|nr:glycosyltransferase family 4 protein [Gracilinema caldarium]AEJ20591.1 glycosyl transferase group 1 [Gracilinema caldarium DSM 7334]
MYLSKSSTIKHIGFVSTRFKGTDGVSLETEKWRIVLEKMGFECFFFSGLSDWVPEKSRVIEEAFFGHPRIQEIQERCFGTTVRSRALTGEIQDIRHRLKLALYDYIDFFKIDLLIIENAVTIPMNIPLGLAITEVIAETGLPTIAHHHDFAWERQRFTVNAVEDYLSMAFPPRLHTINHVVINSEARKQLSYRCGLSSIIIPNVFDFSKEPPPLDDYGRSFRSDLGIKPDETLLLQPTRIIARKGIEHSIELASRLRDHKAKLLISHQERDEGSHYFNRTMEYAQLLGVDVIVRPDIIGPERGSTSDGRKKYCLWDCYLNADFVTYPSLYEGFGNAFLEAIWFRKPILVNRYSIFEQDIEPVDFDVVTMDSYITDDTLDAVRAILDTPEAVQMMTMKNFELGKRFFSFTLLEQRIKQVLMNFGQV